MEKRARYRKPLLLALLTAACLTLFAGLGILDRPDRTASDLLCQQGNAFDGEIAVVGIDQRALNELGPYEQWGRGVVARVIDTLNRSEDCRPAVIGLDVLYIGESDPEADRQLAASVGRYGNVVSACAASFGSEVVADGTGDYLLRTGGVTAFEEPYPALRDVSRQAHVNTMLDTDGILRHHLLFLRLPDGTEVPSLALATAQQYRAARGEAPCELPPTGGRGFWYLPYSGLPGSVECYSVAQVLSGESPPELFAGRIVLIGPYAAGLQDSYLTAIDHAMPMYGVEYHANAIQALLRRDFRREAGNLPQLAALSALLALAFLGFWKRSVKASTALWAALSGGWVLLAKALYSWGLVVHVLWVPTGVTILYVGCLAANYILAALGRRRVTNTFKRYVAPEIVRELLKEGSRALELGGEERDIAVLFVDVRGFTAMSEKLAPTEVVEILNRYLALIADCILRNGGTLDKFIGDAAMAFWNAPVRQEDYVLRAARAALDMTGSAEALSRDLERRFGRAVSFGIGIHIGKAVVGNIGSDKRMDYTAIGDTVNTASRLESNAPKDTIYISRETAQALEGQIITERLPGPLKVKNKECGLEVYKLLGLRTLQ